MEVAMDQNETNVSGNSSIIPGKDMEFDLFFSYSSHDEEAVLPILHLLEDQPYNLSCCVDRRDFMLGETTAKNINHALSHSLGTVFFLTPTFLESAYCNHEIQTAFTMYMEGQCRVIPVVLKPCHIPDEFRTIHYIDEAFPEVIAEKIFKCLSTDPKDYKKQLPLNPIHAGERRINGNRFILNVESNILNKDPMEDFITHYQKREFEKLGIQVKSSLSALVKMVVYLPVHHLYYRKHLKKFFFLSSFVRTLILVNTIAIGFAAARAVLVGYEGIYSDVFDIDFVRFLAYGELGFAVQTWATISIPIAVLQRFIAIHRSHYRVAAVNQLSVLDKQCCFGLKVSFCGEAILTVVKYDVSDCKVYLENLYNEINHHPRDSCFEREWSNITRSSVFPTYIKKLCNETLPHVNEERHRVVNEKLCFCQYFEINSGFQVPNPPGQNPEEVQGSSINDNDRVGLLSEAANNLVI